MRRVALVALGLAVLYMAVSEVARFGALYKDQPDVTVKSTAFGLNSV